MNTDGENANGVAAITVQAGRSEIGPYLKAAASLPCFLWFLPFNPRP